MPKLSDTMTEGTLVSWKKKQGEKVTMGEVIAEVETDKATMEMEAFEDGVLSEIIVQEGQKVAVGEKIALILGEGEAAPSGQAATRAASAEDKQPVPALEKEAAMAGAAIAPSADAPVEAKGDAGSSSSGGRVKASPLARKVAAAQGVDLAGLTGSGPGGRIVQKDVLAGTPGNGASDGAAKAAPAPAPKPAVATAPVKATPAPAPTIAAKPGQTTRIPLTSMRKVIADRLLESKTTIPHFYLRIEVDAGPLAKLRAEINAAGEKEGGSKVSVNDLILKATAAAIAKNPKVNASFTGDSVTEFSSVHLAVAVAVDDGLITPVIRDAQDKSLSQINLEVKDLATRARSKKLKPDEYQGGTFTVSNLGSYGIDNFDAIINPPQAGILSVGALVRKPVVSAAGEIVVGQRMSLGLSCDHRVIDGAVGAQFMATLRHLLENPVLMLL